MQQRDGANDLCAAEPSQEALGNEQGDTFRGCDREGEGRDA